MSNLHAHDHISPGQSDKVDAHAAIGATADENLHSNGFSRMTRPGTAKAVTTKGGIFGTGPDLLAWLTLALAALAVFWPLGLTNRIPAGVDAFTYFTPYWDYRMAAFRAGQVPLWNPYLFLGVPFLANPQAAVLYPLHWPLSWLTAEQALAWSALLHVWLAAGFTYTLGRRSFGLSRAGAWLGGAIFGLGGYLLARVENINQLNALAWFPALLWLYDETARSRDWRIGLRWGSALTAAIALCLLAGHTQSFFIVMVGLGLYAVAGVFRADAAPGATANKNAASDNRRRSAAGPLAPLLAVMPAALLAAAQLLPALELNGLGLRTGGLPYHQAASFSLRPRLLTHTFLPPFGGGLAEAFGSEGYAEFVGYVGIVALMLAGLAVTGYVRGLRFWRAAASRTNEPIDVRADSRSDAHAKGGTTADDIPHVPGTSEVPGTWGGLKPIAALLLLAAAGALLALGAYNPLYYLLWRFVPGFDLFRGPARWLALFALAVALLAGIGLDRLKREGRTDENLLSDGSRRSAHPKTAVTTQGLIFKPISPKTIALILAAAAVLAVIALQQPPPLTSLLGWAGVAAAVALLLRVNRARPLMARWALIALAAGELWLGSRALPFVQATAPMAAGLRNAPAALLAATAQQPPSGRDRFLSLSDIRYDPGDLAELRRLQADRLSPAAIERLVRAAKQVEVIAPNLSLRYRLPAVDGYDGGVLPLARYVQLQRLFVPPETLLPDGRLREQLTQVPDDRLLDLAGVRFVITDKQRDLWADDVYYDLELSASLPPGEALSLDLAAYPAFSATAIGVVAEAFGADVGETEGMLTVIGRDGASVVLAFRPRQGNPATPRPTILALPRPLVPKTITVHNSGKEPLTLRGLSLTDDRTGAHASVTVSQRGDVRRIHTGDVKIYERTSAPGRAWLVHGLQPVLDDAAALALLADPAFDPRAKAVVIGQGSAPRPAAPAGPAEAVTVLTYQEERIVLRVRATTPGVLVIADTWYPGWETTMDGKPADLWRVNLLFRGVPVDAGEHEVTLVYRPASWRMGLVLSLIGLTFMGLALLATVFPSRRQGV